MKKKLLLLISALSLCITGCGKKVEIQETPKEPQTAITKKDVIDIEPITDIEELEKFKLEVFEKLEEQPYAMNVYHELKRYIMKYAVSCASQPNALSRLVELQDKILQSPIYTTDFDEDGASDAHELLLFNTSPMAKSSRENGKLDGKLTSKVSLFVLPLNNKYIVTKPFIGPYVQLAIDKGNIKDTEYIEVKCRLYSDEMSSLVIEPKKASTFLDKKQKLEGAELYPLAISVYGLKNISMPGEIYFYHKGEKDVKDSIVSWVSVDGKSDVDEYLERNKDYTKTNDIINMNRSYVLIRK